MPKIITPTVGRKVWYRPSKFDTTGIGAMAIAGSVEAGTAQPLDATVIAVWGDRMVNLLVVDITGKLYPKLSVTLQQESDPVLSDADGNPVYGYAEWMPYQLGQAKQVA